MSQKPEDDDLESEYDFSGAVRGKYHESYQQGTNVVLSVVKSPLAEEQKQAMDSAGDTPPKIVAPRTGRGANSKGNVAEQFPNSKLPGSLGSGLGRGRP